MSCSDEHHYHDGHGHDEHDHDGPDRGNEFSLYKVVDIDRATCLNEIEPDSIRHVLKPWDARFDTTLVSIPVL
jgi:hypothetical protein